MHRFNSVHGRILFAHRLKTSRGKVLQSVNYATNRIYINPGRNVLLQNRGFHSPLRFISHILRVPAMFAGASAGIATYINYKLDSFYSIFPETYDSLKDFFNGFMPNFTFSSDSSTDDEDKSAEKEQNVQHENISNKNLEPKTANVSEDVLMRLSKLIIEVRDLLRDIDVNEDTQLSKIPGVIVIGSQSSGKSSLLESIVGQEFLPKGNNMVTRRPIELTMICSPDSSEAYSEFPHLGVGKIKSFEKVRRILEDLNRAVPEDECISENPIELRVYSPDVPDLCLVDLPGYIQVTNANQPDTLKQKISDLCDKYIRFNNIILAVCSADVDLANSDALRASRLVDPSGNRTIGVLTKVDLVDPNRVVSILKNKDYPLKLGYVGVALNKGGANPDENLFSKEPYKSSGCILGLTNLKKHIRSVLQDSFVRSLSSITNAIQIELEDARYNFKVMYNDQKITPEGYTAETVDRLKNKFKEFSKQFQKPQLRQAIKDILEDRSAELLFEEYWKSPEILKLNKGKKNYEFWDKRFERVSSQMTKSGVGKITTQLVVDILTSKMYSIASSEIMSCHPELRERFIKLATESLMSNFHTAVDQVENSIKPYKFEIECSDQDWSEARARAIEIFDRKINALESNLSEIQSKTGRRKFRKSMKETYLKMKESRGTGTDAEEVFPLQDESRSFKELCQPEKELDRDYSTEGALSLDCLLSILRARKHAAKSNTCSNSINKSICAEVYLSFIAEKLTQSAAMFIWIELLNDFFYQMPRSIDDRLYHVLSKSEMKALASQNPMVNTHLNIMNKKYKLEEVLYKLRQIRNEI